MSEVTLCDAVPVLRHPTVVPTETLIDAGAYAKSTIDTLGPAAAASPSHPGARATSTAKQTATPR